MPKKVANFISDPSCVTGLSRSRKRKISRKGSIQLDGKQFRFHHAGSFFDTFDEIFSKEIYKFIPVSDNPVIIDCGANMGLSVLYFSEKYPQSEIIAFEPQEDIFSILQQNVNSFGLTNVALHRKAVWDSETTLKFYTDNGMGGSVTNVFQHQDPLLVETTILRNLLDRKIDLLKLDIEGAEYQVLRHCADKLHQVEHIFVEYHSFVHETQHLDDLLSILKQQGFRYHLKESFSRKNPFTENLLACENMDMAINIFAYKDGDLLKSDQLKKNNPSDTLPLVSVCIPIYNGERFLGATLDAAVNQTYPNLEILVTDDGSADSSAAIVQSYASRYPNIRYHLNEKNLGLVGNWNHSVEMASGEWIKFLFQDDIMREDCVEKMMASCLHNNTDFAICSRRFIFESDADEQIKNYFLHELVKPEQVFARKELYTPAETAVLVSPYLVENILGEPIGTIFNKKIFQQSGGFNPRLCQIVDYEFSLRIVLSHPFSFLHEPLVSFRVHGTSQTGRSVKPSSKNHLATASSIKSTIGDFLELLESYQTDDVFSGIRKYWGETELLIHQRYIYLRACKYFGAQKIKEVLRDTLERSNHLRNYRYDWFKYKWMKFLFKKRVKSLLKKPLY